MMKSRKFKACILASTLLTGAGATGAFAQDQVDQGAQATTGSAADDVVVVTGSRIRQANLVSTSPVTQVDSEELDLRGTVRVEDMLNTLPQAFAAQGSAVSNGATGTATVNLRGLGSVRTLVLVNGRRLPFGSPLPAGQAADLNQIPSALVERVEVLTGGASAIYGSDAVSGVVNFIMMDDFEGIRLDAQYSFYQHKNENSVQGLINEFNAINPDQFKLPDDHVIDGETVELTGIMGVNSPDGQGNVTAYVGYRNVDEIRQAERDFSACAFGTRNNGEEFTCNGSGTNAVANFLNVNPALSQGWFRVDPSNGTFIPRDFTTDTFNFNPFNFFQRPDESYKLGAYAHYRVNDHIEPYAELTFNMNETAADIAPSGVFGGGVAGQSGGINCDNPFLSDQQVDFLCTSNGLSGSDIAQGVLIFRRNVEGGARSNTLRHTTFRSVLGVRGNLNEAFDYDVYASYANVNLSQAYKNEVSVTRSSRALNAVRDGSGNIVCSVNADSDPANNDPACVPYDIFSGNGPSQAAINYIGAELLAQGNTVQQVVSGSISGDLGVYDVRMPWADNGVGIAFGAEYRRDFLELNPDAAFQQAPNSDGFGQGSQTLPVEGSTDVYELFGEIQVPIIENRPGFESLSFEAAYRYSDYSSGFKTDTYKIAGDWSPVEDFRLRASFQRAVRAPNVVELFTSQTLGLFDLTAGPNGNFDPCSGDFDPNSANPEPARSFEECARTGVTAAQYGAIADNPAGQFNTLQGGALDLEPEEADTWSVGFVATPNFLPGLTLTVDYFDITIEKLIGTLAQQTVLENCLDTGDPGFCSLVNRGNGGTLWANPTGFIVALNQNTGSLETRGVDVVAGYTVDLGELGADGMGSLDFNLVGTYLDALVFNNLGEAPKDCAGTYAGGCSSIFQTPNPEWRHSFRTTWHTPWQDISLSGSWRYFSSVDLFGGGAEINQTLDEQHYFDLAGVWQVRENARINLGVNNIFDNDPPLSSVVGSGAGNGNTFPQVYDTLGRYVFAGATVDF